MTDYQTLRQLTEDACCGMFGLPIHFDPGIQLDSKTTVGARVTISGDVVSHVTIRCESGFADRLATTMYMADRDALSKEEVHDAIGELVNIIGGNIKGLVAGEAHLSLPCVGEADSFLTTGTDGDLVEVTGHCDGHMFSIRLESPAISAVAG